MRVAGRMLLSMTWPDDPGLAEVLVERARPFEQRHQPCVALVDHGGERVELANGELVLEVELEPGTPHDERYGPQGATFWVARRHPAA